MGLTPFTISASGKDRTEKFADRLIKLTITDEAGLKSDECAIELDNRGKAIAVPGTNERLRVSLSDKVGSWDMGSYVVDEVITTWPTRTLTIRARAVDMLAEMKVKRDKQWADITLGNMVHEIAGRYGMSARVGQALADIDIAPIPYAQLDQLGESDFHFLTRIAKDYGATFKVIDSVVSFLPRSEGQKASGAPQVTRVVEDREVLSVRVRVADRQDFQSAKAYYRDSGSEERVPVIVGAGEPTYNLTRTYPDANTAERAATARLDALQRGKATLTLTVDGRPDIRAEMRLRVNVDDDLARGEWMITRATHEYTDAGLRTQIEAESPKERKL